MDLDALTTAVSMFSITAENIKEMFHHTLTNVEKTAPNDLTTRQSVAVQCDGASRLVKK